ncbi:MAG: exodeoxyribonuclease V subunit gamma [Lachnospiraceae bacterium]|nr:exodeoxyribonuclease V subunit gamma [Lachnospiraceae bacterium]
MALRFVLGPSGAGKTTFIYDEIIKKSIDNPSENYILIVPDQFTMAVQKDIVERHPRHGVMNIDIVSFSRLAFRVFEELGINKLSVLDDTGKTLILRRVLEMKKGELEIFKDKLKYFGFVEQMKSSISELYQYGISPENLKDILANMSGHGTTRMKLSDISIIYDAFKEYVTSMSGEESVYITREEVLSRLCQAVPDSAVIRDSHIYLDGFTGFTPVQSRLIKLLLEYAANVTVGLTIDISECATLTGTGFVDVKEHELFNMTKTTVNTLMSMAADIHVQPEHPVLIESGDKSRYAGNEPLAHIERSLFRYGDTKKVSSDGAVSIYVADNPLAEAQFVADKIVSMVMEGRGELRYRDIAVVTGDLEGYRRLVERSLKSRGIPAFMDTKRSLIGNPLVNIIRSILQMVDENFSYESVFSYLKNVLGPLSKDETDILENYCLGLGVRGYSEYSQPFVRVHKQMSDDDLKRCEDIRVKLMASIDSFFSRDIKSMTVREVSSAVMEFVGQMGLQSKMQEFSGQFKAMGEHSLALEYEQAYELTEELIAKLDSLLGQEKLSLKEYRRLLDDGFQEIKVGIIPMVMDQVVVGDIERTRLNNIKVLFVLGVNDGIIPKHTGAIGLLSQSDKVVLKNMELELSPTVREAAFIQKFYLYLNLTKPTDQLILTYSLSSSDGSALRPSYLVGTIADMFQDGIQNVCDHTVHTLVTKERAFNTVVSGIKAYGDREIDTLWAELYSYFRRDDRYREALSRAIEGAFFTNADSELDEAVAKELYGDRLGRSITRLEQYARCAYAHFLNYGLQLAERPVYEIKSADIGNIFHEAIELFSREIVARELSYENVTDDIRRDIVDNVVEQVTEKYGGHVLTSSARNSYMIEKIRRVTDRSAWAIIEHIKRGKYNPSDFELSLREGRIDRVDRYTEDGNIYVKVIDYKSGATTFSPTDVENGLQLQLIYYMDTLVKREQSLYPGSNVKPGGVFYFNIKDPMLDYEESMMDDDTYREKLLKEYRMTGAVNSQRMSVEALDTGISESSKNSSVAANLKYGDIDKDISVGSSAATLSEDSFNQLIDRVKVKIANMTREIEKGNIDMNPYKRGQRTACDYCKYRDVCGFDDKQFENRYRQLHHTRKEDIERLWGSTGEEE